MQTCRHVIFAVLALCMGACAAKADPASTPPRPREAESARPKSHAEAPDPPVQIDEPGAFSAAPAVLGPRTGSGAPTIALVRISSPTTVEVHFNEPVAVAESFDPSFFRLSVGAFYDDGDESETYYYDPGTIIGPSQPTVVHGVAVLDELTVRLLLARPLAAEVCEEVEEMRIDTLDTPGATVGLFLHYRDDEGGGITDADGLHLDDIAAHWVERPATEASFAGTHLPPISAAGPIDCHFTR